MNCRQLICFKERRRRIELCHRVIQVGILHPRRLEFYRRFDFESLGLELLQGLLVASETGLRVRDTEFAQPLESGLEFQR